MSPYLTSVDSRRVKNSQPLGWSAQGRQTSVTYLLTYLLISCFKEQTNSDVENYRCDFKLKYNDPIILCFNPITEDDSRWSQNI